MALHFLLKVVLKDNGNENSSSKREKFQATYSLLCCLRCMIPTIRGEVSMLTCDYRQKVVCILFREPCWVPPIAPTCGCTRERNNSAT